MLFENQLPQLLEIERSDPELALVMLDEFYAKHEMLDSDARERSRSIEILMNLPIIN
jgi:hypothetical protein